MDMSPTAMLKTLGPRMPLILKTTVLHTLGWSETASKQDLQTELLIAIIRSFMDGSNPMPLSKMQKLSMKDPGIKGNMWVSKVTVPKPPEDDVRQLLFRVIEEMKEGDETYTKPDLLPVEAEWVGYRSNVDKNAPEPSISESEKYEHLMGEVESKVTMLYFHGGAMYLMDPCTHRGLESTLANLSGGRTYSVRYRLSPQGPFPAALLDALVSYLALLCPPAGALHEPVSPSNIVLTGDSAGGNLCMALLQLLLHINGQTLKFYGQDVTVRLPAGVATSSPWEDVTRSLPSLETNAKFDYLPPPSNSRYKTFPTCDIWPTKPPRVDIYCDGSAMSHPLVSPLAAKSWAGAPPIFFLLGQEMLEDENKVIAGQAVKQGVKVVWEQYEALPHHFIMMMEWIEASKMAYKSWGKFIKDVVERPEEVKTSGTWVTAKKLERQNLDLSKLDVLSEDEVRRRMKEFQAKRREGEEKEGKVEPAQPVPKL
ncbi:acetyl-hydrolase [Rhizodiscina lignyota]|uniref:Acetyl-hydrolase n=1 Tax=Rhizodiscina lignyota TaxID=1504668 RepID=A0A9P4I904_9PEZI|nr:acetyl-hydrolase [Rhizodiscina lignyota]